MRMHTGVNKQAFFKVQVTYADGTPVNDATVYLYNIGANPATYLGQLSLVPAGNGVYGVNPVTSYGDCWNIGATGDIVVEALASRNGITASVTGTTLSSVIYACP